MDIEQFRDHCMALEGVTEKMPFGKFARRYESLLVFYVLDHMFCIVDIDDFSYVDVRSNPDEKDLIKAAFTSVSEPVNRAMKHWVELDFGGDIDDETVFRLVDRAYAIVRERYSREAGRKVRRRQGR